MRRLRSLLPLLAGALVVAAAPGLVALPVVLLATCVTTSSTSTTSTTLPCFDSWRDPALSSRCSKVPT